MPESAKICASRLEENVPILSEQVCVAMPASTGGASGSRDPISPIPPVPLPPPAEVPPVHPDDSPRSSEPLRLVREVVPHFGDEVEEVFRSEDVVREAGDEAIDSDDESKPWVPSLREKLQNEAKSVKHALTHFPKTDTAKSVGDQKC